MTKIKIHKLVIRNRIIQFYKAFKRLQIGQHLH